MTIKKKVDRLVKKHGTRNPFEIAEDKGFLVIYENLGSMYGYFSHQYRTTVIHINENLSYEKQLTVCAHELHHALEDKHLNTAFMKSSTYFSTDKMEIEANEFMIELLFNQEHPDPITIEEAIEKYGVPEQLLKKKFYP